MCGFRGGRAALAAMCLALAPVLAGAQPAGTGGVDVVEASILELQAAMAAGRTTARDLVDAFLARIAAYDRRGPRINAFVTLNPRAREEADALDRERSERGPRGLLHGIPVVVKDNFSTADMPTTAGTLALAGLRAERDAYQVRRLREAGAIILGKTTLHELASGITTISSLTGQTRNPYDPARNPGGSSGGTAAAVAASFAVAGLGSDTCGSIRVPAAHNNLVGLRGTLGLSSRSGVVPLSHTQDIAGPLARSVTDLAILLDATVGYDPADPSTAEGNGNVPASYRDSLRADALHAARIGILDALWSSPTEDEDVDRAMSRALDELKDLGVELVHVTVPGFDALIRESSVINDEFKFDLADYLAGIPGAPVRSLGEILEQGLYHAALERSLVRRNAPERRDTDHYRRALVKRTALRAAVLAAMDDERLDAIVYPSIRRRPAIAGEPQGGGTCQLSASTGLPALAIPAGFTEGGLPVGVDLLGRAFAEPRLLAMAYAFEQATHHRRPPRSTPRLVNGAAPPPVAFTAVVGRSGGVAEPLVEAQFTLDPPTGTLRYAVSTRVSRERLLAVTIQRGEADTAGPVLFHLLDGDATSSSGDVRLGPSDLDDLEAGRLYLHLYTRDHVTSAGRSMLVLPR